MSALFFFLVSCLYSSTLTAASLAPGYAPLTFTAPVSGTYSLPELGKAQDGRVLDSQAHEHSLLALMKGKVVLLSFIYSSCDDVNGCPLATFVLHKIQQHLSKHLATAQQLRLLTLSFNPEHDTPDVMGQYGRSFQNTSLDWQFLTTRSEQELAPILHNYQLSVQKINTDDGKFTGKFTHALKVFLIDEQQKIRNIYSADFLHPETLLSDINALVTHQTHNNSPKPHATPVRPTRKPSLLGLPKLPVPRTNPLTKAKIELGRKLFFDRRLSFNNTVSCAMCHLPEQGFTSNDMATAVGVEGRSVRRNAPTLYNVAYATTLFHDGREHSLEQQVWGPLLAHNEMANPSMAYVLDKINQQADYHAAFTHAFNKPATMETLGMALASYQRSLTSAHSAFDRWLYQHESTALSSEAQHGYTLFIGKAGCAKCHTINTHSAVFSDQQFHNTGIAYQANMVTNAPTQQLEIAPKVFVNVANSLINSVSASKQNDLGRYEISQNPAHRWQYKTPSLRNIALTAPYMHNGSLRSLSDVLDFSNAGGVAHEQLDPLIKPLNLSPKDLAALLAFLQALTGDNVKQIVNEALSEPIGN